MATKGAPKAAPEPAGLLSVPTVPRNPWGILALVLNIVLPGTGSIAAGGAARDLRTAAFGLVQLVLFWTLLGWIWSIVWGVRIFLRSE